MLVWWALAGLATTSAPMVPIAAAAATARIRRKDGRKLFTLIVLEGSGIPRPRNGLGTRATAALYGVIDRVATQARADASACLERAKWTYSTRVVAGVGYPSPHG